MEEKIDYSKMDYEEAVELVKKRNEKYLDIFLEELKSKGITPKTIENHMSNVEFYINDYLCHYDAQDLEKGLNSLDDFFGYFFIKKCAWSTPSSIKSTAASLKKFYKCMAEHGFIDMDDYRDFAEEIKDNMAFWQETCDAWNNGEFLFSDLLL